MKYQCVRCNGTWGSGNPETEGYSHGLCLNCLLERLTPLYRSRQKQEGNPDCFRRSLGFCHQHWCAFYEKCLAPMQEVEPGPETLTYVAAGSHMQPQQITAMQ